MPESVGASWPSRGGHWRGWLGRAVSLGMGAHVNAPVDEIGDVARGGVLGAIGELRPLRRGELSFEAIEQALGQQAHPKLKEDQKDLHNKLRAMAKLVVEDLNQVKKLSKERFGANG